MPKISLFNSSKAETPAGVTTVDAFIEDVRIGKWKRQISVLRTKKDPNSYKRFKALLPAVTISGEFKTRNKETPLEKKLFGHSGFICIDVDKKDNPKLRTVDLVDNECYAQFASCSGEGIKIIYRCEEVSDAATHRRIYDAVAQRLEKKKIKLKIDPVVKSIASLQYISHDPQLYFNPKSKLIIKPLPPVKYKKREASEDVKKELEQLEQYVEALGGKDVTKDYEDWLTVLFGLSYSLGEEGREIMHKICKNYPGYSQEECDEKYDTCLERNMEAIERPVTIASVFQLVNEAIPKVTLRNLSKKYNKGHAIGVGEDVEHGDLAGMVRYKLFLFKKIFDKESNTLIELVPYTINLNEFESLLRNKGFFRFEDSYVHIVDNIVERVDLDDILRIITRHIEAEGDYQFTYRKIEFHFSWEELVHLWRTLRAYGTTYNQISASLDHWKPNLLRDTPNESYIPYQNGVVKVSAKKIELVPYSKLKCASCKLAGMCQVQCSSINKQIWKERILPRNFEHTEKAGMFEDFFVNVAGRGKNTKEKRASENFHRALWYYGYMLQGSKRQSTARAWLLYDIKTGNNGRSGKTIIGQAIGKIRSMVILDGKNIDFKNRFAFQTVEPWTDVVFIDDPSKFMSLNPLFNMITGEMAAEKKGLNPVTKAVKFMIASNWVLEAEGSSELGRQFITQLDDFYVRYSKENNNTITPIVDLHGKEFFTDWNDKDWSQFDSFSVRALQYHLKTEAPQNTILGNSQLVRFIQLNEEELFYELSLAVTRNAIASSDGGTIVSQQLLVSIIEEHTKSDKNKTKAGKLAREYLRAIGATEISMTTIKVGGLTKMAYKINKGLKELDFGDFNVKS